MEPIRIMRLPDPEKSYINIGCGTVTFDDCVNMDIADNPLVDAQVIGSVLDIPFEDETFRGVLFCHVLEHLFKREHRRALLEIRRVLKDKGTVYIEVPDLERAMFNFLANDKGRKEYWYMCIYGREDYATDVHKSGITEQYLTDLLFDCGFGKLKWMPIEKEQALLGVIATKLNDMPGERL